MIIWVGTGEAYKIVISAVFDLNVAKEAQARLEREKPFN